MIDTVQDSASDPSDALVTSGDTVLAGKRICYVSTEAFSGTSRTMKQADSLAAAGASVFFVGYEEYLPAGIRDSSHAVVTALYRPAPTPGWLSPPLAKLYNRTLRRARNAWRRVAAPRDLVAAIVSTGADIVQSVDLPALKCASLAARQLGAVLAFDSHEMWSGFLDNPEVGLSASDRRRLLRMERTYAPSADVVFVVSDEMGRRMRARYPLKSTLTVFNSPPGHLTSSTPTHTPVRLVFHGSLAATKNVDGLILAMKHLKGRATLDVHGGALTVREDQLQQLIAQNDLSDTVTLHGAFRYESVLPLLSEYDVGVYAAKQIEENFAISLPNKLFDCICAGLAVAMSDFPAIKDVVEQSGCGICLDPTSAETIALALGGLVDDPSAIDEMKARSREFAPTCSWDAQAAKIIGAFENLLS